MTSDLNKEKLRVVNDIYAAVHVSEAGAAVRHCLRLARLARDPAKTAEFHFEMGPRGLQVATRLTYDLPDYEETQIKALYERARDRLLEDRTIAEHDAKLLEFGDARVLFVSAGMFEDEISVCDGIIASLQLPAGMTPFDTAQMRTESQKPRAMAIYKKRAVSALRDVTLSKCFDYASQIEKQIYVNVASDSSLNSLEDEVFSFCRERFPTAFHQLTEAAKRLLDPTNENISSAATLVRKRLKSVADELQPANNTVDGLKEAQYLNRLSFYIESRSQVGATGSILNHSLLEELVRRLNDRASKGVHATLSPSEGRQIYIGLIFYMHHLSQIAEPM